MQHLSKAMNILGIFSSLRLSAWCTPLVETPSGCREKEHLDTVTPMSCRHFLFCQHTSRYEVILALLPTCQETVGTADITPELCTRRKSLKQQPDSCAVCPVEL